MPIAVKFNMQSRFLSSSHA